MVELEVYAASGSNPSVVYTFDHHPPFCIVYVCGSALFPIRGPPISPRGKLHSLNYCCLSLSVMYQRQWAHRCDVFTGEAILEGRLSMFQSPRALLYFSLPGSDGRMEYEYIITPHGNDSNIWTFDFNRTSFTEGAEGLQAFYPSVRSIAYDLNKHTMSATCTTIGSPTLFPCMWGSFDRENYFRVSLNDTRTLIETDLRAVDRESFYSDDAPSFTLNDVKPDGQLGNMVMQSAVTKRSHCELLKVCLGSNTPGLDILAPLGLVLWAQDRYTTYCTTPRLYA